MSNTDQYPELHEEVCQYISSDIDADTLMNAIKASAAGNPVVASAPYTITAERSRDTIFHSLASANQHCNVAIVLKLLLGYTQYRSALLVKSRCGDTPLHKACSSFESLEVVRLLLQYPEGVESASMENAKGMTPAQSALYFYSASMGLCGGSCGGTATVCGKADEFDECVLPIIALLEQAVRAGCGHLTKAARA